MSYKIRQIKMSVQETHLQKAIKAKRPMPQNVLPDEQICADEECQNTVMWVRTLADEPCDRCGAPFKCWTCMVCDRNASRRVCKVCTFTKIVKYGITQTQPELEQEPEYIIKQPDGSLVSRNVGEDDNSMGVA